MNTTTAITIVMEDLQEMTFKMVKANIDEFNANKEETLNKYMLKALELKSKARTFLAENMDDVARYVEFGLKGGK